MDYSKALALRPLYCAPSYIGYFRKNSWYSFPHDVLLLLCFKVWLFTCKAPSYLFKFLKTLPVKSAHNSFFAVPRLRLKQTAFALAAPKASKQYFLAMTKNPYKHFLKSFIPSSAAHASVVVSRSNCHSEHPIAVFRGQHVESEMGKSSTL